MKNVENLGKWAVIGGAMIWVGSLVITALGKYRHVGTLLVVGGALVFVVGWVL